MNKATIAGRVMRRWHRWGRVHWYLGTHGDYGYGWHWFRGAMRDSKVAAFGPLFVSVWPKKRVSR